MRHTSPILLKFPSQSTDFATFFLLGLFLGHTRTFSYTIKRYRIVEVVFISFRNQAAAAPCSIATVAGSRATTVKAAPVALLSSAEVEVPYSCPCRIRCGCPQQRCWGHSRISISLSIKCFCCRFSIEFESIVY